MYTTVWTIIGKMSSSAFSLSVWHCDMLYIYIIIYILNVNIQIIRVKSPLVWIIVKLSVIYRLVGLCPPFICHSLVFFLTPRHSLVTDLPTRSASLGYCLTHLGYFQFTWPRTSVQAPQVSCGSEFQHFQLLQVKFSLL